MLAAAMVVGAATSSAATELKGTFRGNAFGTEANAKAGDVAVSLGRSAYLPCGCKGTGGKTVTNRVDSVQARDVARADVLLSTLRTTRDAANAFVTTSSTVSGVNLFSGLITATAIKAVASTRATSTSMSSSIAGSTFTNLKVAGVSVSADVAPNKTLALPGIGKVTFKKTATTSTSTVNQITVDMLVIDVTMNNSFKLAIGAQIKIGHAFSGYWRAPSNVEVGGQAWATESNTKVGKDLVNRIGRAAFVSFSCEGTSGKTRTNNVAGTSIGKILTYGSGYTTGTGGPNASGATAKTTATLESVKLLNGLITASIVKAVAEETMVNGKLTRSTKGSGLIGLKVMGLSIPANLPPNTRLALPGIGYVIVNEQLFPTGSRSRTQVNGLHVVITSVPLLGSLGLPVGSEIIVAHADAFVQK
ncbi:choice-of-anchor P family protein [Geminicoccus roseus]|uniref:choice-of-anchor P family protein n=1 Tax=Geminicoccus roseus TaxID=404900 RepID=UPI0004178D53|nr:choice-of-anchor P family protein [Geminicoccus roseus]